MTLDIPTPRVGSKEIKNKKIFLNNLKESKENALTMLKYKNDNIEEAYNPDFKLFNCIHGANLDQMETWYKETTNNKDVEYDGFALSTGKHTKYLLALRLGFAIENSRGKPFHVFGTSSPSSIALIAYANKYTKTQIYFDSSSAATGRELRKFMLFWNLTSDGISFKEKNRDYEKYYSLECPCPICSQLQKPEDLWELGTKSGILLTLHNLFWITNYTAFISNLVHYENEFESYINSIARDSPDGPYKNILPKKISWVLYYINFLDSVNEKGLENAWNKFFTPVKSVASNLSDFDKDKYTEINPIPQKMFRTPILFANEVCKNAMNSEILNPETQEIIKGNEVVDQELSKVSKSSKNNKKH